MIAFAVRLTCDVDDCEAAIDTHATLNAEARVTDIDADDWALDTLFGWVFCPAHRDHAGPRWRAMQRLVRP